jgi:hypothetical protein
MPAASPATLAPGSAGLAKGPSPARLSQVAWMPTRELNLADWIAAGQTLGAMGRCGQWGLGDWIRYGNAKFGERYTTAAQITGYDTQTLMNMVYVASHFEISRRREKLSWSHHEAVVALPPEEQDRWLDLAENQRITVIDFRAELRSARRAAEKAAGNKSQTETSTESPHMEVCPTCGQALPAPPQDD